MAENLAFPDDVKGTLTRVGLANACLRLIQQTYRSCRATAIMMYDTLDQGESSGDQGEEDWKSIWQDLGQGINERLDTNKMQIAELCARMRTQRTDIADFTRKWQKSTIQYQSPETSIEWDHLRELLVGVVQFEDQKREKDGADPQRTKELSKAGNEVVLLFRYVILSGDSRSLGMRVARQMARIRDCMLAAAAIRPGGGFDANAIKKMCSIRESEANAVLGRLLEQGDAPLERALAKQELLYHLGVIESAVQHVRAKVAPKKSSTPGETNEEGGAADPHADENLLRAEVEKEKQAWVKRIPRRNKIPMTELVAILAAIKVKSRLVHRLFEEEAKAIMQDYGMVGGGGRIQMPLMHRKTPTDEGKQDNGSDHSR